MVKLISDAARDLIVSEEVSSKATYEARYQRPEWPGGGSGITIGIGYDVGAGVRNSGQLRADWGNRIPDSMIEVLVPCIGVTGESAARLLAGIRPSVNVPWVAAIDVFDAVDVPRWYAICVKALPNFDLLSLDCKGVLLSLAYNRGASFAKDGDRYTEMRAIKTHMIAKAFDKIPAELRAMKRLWPSQSMRGLVLRREHEARLFEQGLKTAVVVPSIPTPAPVPPPSPPAITAKTATAGAIVASGGVAAQQAHAHSWGNFETIAIVAVSLAIAALAWLFIHHATKK